MISNIIFKSILFPAYRYDTEDAGAMILGTIIVLVVLVIWSFFGAIKMTIEEKRLKNRNPSEKINPDMSSYNFLGGYKVKMKVKPQKRRRRRRKRSDDGFPLNFD